MLTNLQRFSKAEKFLPKATVAVLFLWLGVFALAVGLPCPFAKMGISCLGCGTTRAVRAALAGNFSEALRFNGMFWAIPLLCLYGLKDLRLFENKRVNDAILAVIFAGYIIDYCVRLIG